MAIPTPISPVPRDLFDIANKGRWFEDIRRELNYLIYGNTKFSTITTTPYTTTINDNDIFVDTDSAAVVVNLIAGVNSKSYRIVNVGTSGKLVTITPNGSEKLLGVNSSFTINDAETLIITFSSTDGWY